MEMMASYLEKARDAKGQLLHPNLGGQSAWAKAALPPPLLREGERVQPDWLYRFLRNPGKIRPQEKDGGIMVLRMPRFNMSDDEAMALVNYFAAADRLSNPGEALNYPYQGVPQRDPEFWRRQSRVYEARLTKEELDAQAARLEPIWKQYLADLDNRLKEAEDKVKEAEKRVEATEQPLKKLDEEITKLQDALKKDPKDAKAKQALKEAQENRLKLLPAYQEAERTRKILDEYAKPLRVQADKDALPRLKAHWLDNGVYGSAAYQLLVQRSPCLECHQASNMGTPKGPPLDLSAERLRPEWTLQWLANPRRLTTYDTPMPQNFARSADPFAGFKGSSRDRAIVEQMTALRDLLMNYPDVADRPANRYFPTTLGGKGP
jgi:tetratricopeptide (TPR) repeat protein